MGALGWPQDNGSKTEFMVSGYVDSLSPPPKFHLSSGLELNKVLAGLQVFGNVAAQQYERFQAKAYYNSVIGN